MTARGTSGFLRSRTLDFLIFVAAFLALWQLAHLWGGDVAMTTPFGTLDYTLRLLVAAEFWPHAIATATAFVVALILACTGGVLIGAALGSHRLSGEVAEPILVGIYSIPKVTLYPIILLFFGIGISAEIAFGALHGVIPIILFTMNAVRNIKPVFVKTARVMNLGAWAMLRTVLLPATLPEVFTGLRVGFALTLIGTLLSEMFGSRRGIGFMLMNAIGLHNMDVIMSLTFMLVAFAGTVNALLLIIDHRLHRRV
ncbi:MAG TPA: ABC transporter permease subunit [Alphaproteobacteria bacterium]|nr:ABC transporter permease subunit [Alphaproteobacteria bacterium]